MKIDLNLEMKGIGMGRVGENGDGGREGEK